MLLPLQVLLPDHHDDDHDHGDDVDEGDNLDDDENDYRDIYYCEDEDDGDDD